MPGVSSHGKSVIGLAPGPMAREQELGELGGKRPGRPGVRPVVGIGLIAAIGGVRHDAARGEEKALEFVPLGRGVDAGADARNLHDLVNDRPVAEAFDENRIGLGRQQRRRPAAGFPGFPWFQPRRCGPSLRREAAPR